MENIILQPGDYTTRAEIKAYAEREGIELKEAYQRICDAFMAAGADEGERAFFWDCLLDVYGWSERSGIFFRDGPNDAFTRHLTPDQILSVGKEQGMNDWYEKGELPPAGTKCEYVIGANRTYIDCTLVGLNSRGNVVIETSDGEYLDYHKHQIKFRPAQTERDKLIASAEATFESSRCVFTADHRAVVVSLIDANWRPTKQQSEDEFCTEAWEKCNAYKETAENLYRAGCRFLDQGGA